MLDSVGQTVVGNSATSADVLNFLQSLEVDNSQEMEENETLESLDFS